MTYTTILPASTLADHLNDPAWVIIDCRFDLANPLWGFAEYQEAHIPGAVYADLNRDLSGPVTETSGRHPLPDENIFTSILSSWGVDNEKQVVVYDVTGGSFAARLWWMLRTYGHSSVAVLDGGFPMWLAQNLPTQTGIIKRSPAAFVGKPDPNSIVDAKYVDSIRQDSSFKLIDARMAIRFSGEQETIDRIGGHIPGAVNLFLGSNLAPDGTFLPREVLRIQFETLLNGLSADQSIVYCGSGVTSCHHLVAMAYAGLEGSRLYPGSWSEWIRDPVRPIATGYA